MKHRYTALTGIVLGAALLLSAIGCTGAPAGSGNATSAQETQPAAPEPDTRQLTDTTAYKARLSNNFEGIEPATAAELTFTADADGVTITGYTGGATVLVIPAELDGKPVVAVGEGAFRGALRGEREGVGVGAGALLHETAVPAKGLGAQPAAEETFAERDEQGGVRLREVVAPQAVRGAPIKGGMLAEGRRRPPAAHGGAEDAMEGDGKLGIRVAHDGGLGKWRDVQAQLLAHLAHGGLGGGLAGLDLAARELPFVGGGGITRGAAPDAEHGSGVIQDHGRGHAKMGFFHGVSLRGDGGARGWRR